jgi:hypothetical protein
MDTILIFEKRVAFDLEWNSKDQTFDRDLLAFRTYYDCDIVSTGIIITRCEELNDVFRTVFDYNVRTGRWGQSCVNMALVLLGWGNCCRGWIRDETADVQYLLLE